MPVKPPRLLRKSAIVGMVGLALLLWSAPPANGQVKRIVIDKNEGAVPGGKNKGGGGAYTRITGKAFGEIDPKDRRNAIINDIELAPRNERGMVEYVATFSLSVPKDLSKASGVLFYLVPNRGARPGDPGDLLARGDIILSSGWQGDIRGKAGAETITVPVAKNKDGSSITGPVVTRFTGPQAGTKTLSLPNSFALASKDTTQATLTKRTSAAGVAIPIAGADWAFSDCRQVAFPGTPDPTRISIKGGFESKYIYDVVYLVKDPKVLGMGYAATRDIISFFRHAAKDENGTANPVYGDVKHVIAKGDSQAGNFIKSFIHLGFNEDLSGRIVWDGANPHIAGRQQPLNFRFAVPGGAVNFWEPGSEGVLWWSDYPDTARGRATTGLLARAKAAGVMPKIFETFGSAEIWGLRMSPALVGTKADADIPLPANVRRYYFPGTTHGGGSGGFNVGAGGAKDGGSGGLAANSNSQQDTIKALRVALIDWVVKGVEPPPSQYPLLAKGQLVLPDHVSMGFPRIPGMPLPDQKVNLIYDYDFGPEFRANDLSGAFKFTAPPAIKQIIPSLVPKVDADGNEIGGVPSVLHQAPLGTYLGWNVQTPNGSYVGGFIPFAKTKKERLAAGDPRLSLEERYRDHAGYVAVVKAAAERQVKERFLLPDDAAKLIKAAEAGNVLR
ncbi:MAG TPA: alpha/beta hydrolase domain-containing protein [Gemmataceae bacterium]|nr:alpha/beta hydrolase domain-containing protein [Gemmataceae bacterium]